MGSGDAPKPPRSQKGRSLDLVGTGPWEVNDTSGVRRGVPVIHDELLGTIDSSTGFVSTPQVLQPGLVTNMPWGSRLAQLYQRYRVKNFEYYYKPFVSQFDALGQRGRIVLCFDYDALSQNLTTLTQAETLTPHVVGMGYESLVLRLDGLRCTGRDGKFIRTGPAAVGSDIKSYDSGVLYVVTSGFGSVAQLGELHARYELELLNPMLPDAIAPQINYAASVCADLSLISLTSTVLSNSVLGFTAGVNSSLRVANGLGLTFVGGGATGQQLIMPAGMFLVCYYGEFTNSSTVTNCQITMFLNTVAQLGGTANITAACVAGVIHLHGSLLLNAIAGDILTLGGVSTFIGTNQYRGKFSIVNV